VNRSGDPAIEGGSSGDRVDRLTRTIRDQTFPKRQTARLRHPYPHRPQLGHTESIACRRHERHKFMPGKFRFSWRAIEQQIGRMAASGTLHEATLRA